ncbi:hypothetical protein MMC13_007488 [Lambiella insularis]|nr:hypothetical protein [Lambiella insularis]
MPATNSHSTIHLPIIDISHINEVTGHELVNAAIDYGFVFIKSSGLGFDAETIDGAFEISRNFFHSAREEKLRYKMENNNRGWTAMHEEILDPENSERGDPKEGFNFGEFLCSKAQQPLPLSLQAHEVQLSNFTDLCRELAMQLLELFAVGLEAGQAGLEILDPSSNWVPVPVVPAGTEDDPFPPILVNIGDLLSYWTGGLLKSTVHRVVFPPASEGVTGDRFSISYFFHPSRDTKLENVPSELVRQRGKVKPGGGILTAMEHLNRRLAATYGWGEDDNVA